MSVNKKLLEYAEFKGISQRKFTASLGLSEGVLRRGKNIGSGYLIRVREKYPDLSMEWLLFDKGNMLIESPEGMVSDTPLSYGKESIECCNEVFTLQKELLETQKKLIDAHELNQVLQGQIQPIKKHDNETAPKS